MIEVGDGGFLSLSVVDALPIMPVRCVSAGHPINVVRWDESFRSGPAGHSEGRVFSALLIAVSVWPQAVRAGCMSTYVNEHLNSHESSARPTSAALDRTSSHRSGQSTAGVGRCDVRRPVFGQSRHPHSGRSHAAGARPRRAGAFRSRFAWRPIRDVSSTCMFRATAPALLARLHLPSSSIVQAFRAHPAIAVSLVHQSPLVATCAAPSCASRPSRKFFRAARPRLQPATGAACMADPVMLPAVASPAPGLLTSIHVRGGLHASSFASIARSR